MAKGYCPVCDTLVGIAPTNERRDALRGSCMWWRVDMHRAVVDGVATVCDGSGRKV